MAVRGVYTKAEKEMLENFAKTAEGIAGWAKSLRISMASEDSVKNNANAVDCWNPLWQDPKYARETRWGGIIAPPMYQDCVVSESYFPDIPPSAGYPAHWYIGEDWEFFKPVRINDSFKVWRRSPKLEDVTDPDGKGLRKLKFTAHDLDIINQKDELINTFRLYVELTLHPEPLAAEKVKSLADYVYTPEELKYIDGVISEEKVRGASIRYWEDVEVGEETAPVVLGPTTIWDQVAFFAGRQELPFLPGRELRRRTPPMFAADPATGVYHSDIEWHFSNDQAHLRCEPHAFHFGALARQLMARLVTNWMGDDGFLRAFSWRHMKRTSIGDTVMGRGKVVNKRIENGEHLVDLAVYLENIRGNNTEAAWATVSLCSKQAPYKWK